MPLVNLLLHIFLAEIEFTKTLAKLPVPAPISKKTSFFDYSKMVLISFYNIKHLLLGSDPLSYLDL